MSETFEQNMPTQGDAPARQADAHARAAHLHAFNFGRSVGRMESAREAFWTRVRWLAWGAAAGVTLAALYLQIFLSERILHLAR